MQPLRNSRSWKCQFNPGLLLGSATELAGDATDAALAPETAGLSLLAPLLQGLLQGGGGSPGQSLASQNATMGTAGSINAGPVTGGAGGSGGFGLFGGGGGGGGGGASESNSQANNSNPQTMLNYQPSLNLGSTFDPNQPTPFQNQPAPSFALGSAPAPAPYSPPAPSSSGLSPLDQFAAMARGGPTAGSPFLSGGIAQAGPSGAPAQAQPSPQNPTNNLTGQISQALQQAPTPFQGNVSQNTNTPQPVGGMGGGLALQPPTNLTASPGAAQTAMANPLQVLSQLSGGEPNNLQGEEAQAIDAEGTPMIMARTPTQLHDQILTENKNHTAKGLEVAQRHQKHLQDRIDFINNLNLPFEDAAEKVMTNADLAVAQGKANLQGASADPVEIEKAREEAWDALLTSDRDTIRERSPQDMPKKDPQRVPDAQVNAVLQGNAQKSPTPKHPLLSEVGKRLMNVADHIGQAGAVGQASQFWPNNAPLVANRLQNAANDKRAWDQQKIEHKDFEELKKEYRDNVQKIINRNMESRHLGIGDAVAQAKNARAAYTTLTNAKNTTINQAFEQERSEAANEFKALETAIQATNSTRGVAQNESTNENAAKSREIAKSGQKIAAGHLALAANADKRAADEAARKAAQQPGIDKQRGLNTLKTEFELKKLGAKPALTPDINPAPQVSSMQLAEIKIRAAKDPAFAAKARAKGFKI